MKYRDILAFARLLRRNQTPAEIFFWNRVRNRGLFEKKFKRQFIIQHAEILGEKKYYIADFYCHEKLLVVEIDGKIHLQQQELDFIREEKLKFLGFIVVRFTNEEVLGDWQGVKRKLEVVLNVG
jgi:very-short-patch-repair endonuclease